jgi:hypothetical protein
MALSVPTPPTQAACHGFGLKEIKALSQDGGLFGLNCLRGTYQPQPVKRAEIPKPETGNAWDHSETLRRLSFNEIRAGGVYRACFIPLGEKGLGRRQGIALRARKRGARSPR